MKLYTAQVCPFAHRVRLALAWKGLESERIEIDLAAVPEWYRQLSPNQKVPLLIDQGQSFWESALINEYLEDQYPSTPLRPATAEGAFRARLLVDWAGQHLIPPFYGLLRNSDAEATQKLQAALEELARMCDPKGPYLLGQTPSLADAGLYPWFERWPVLDHYRKPQFIWPSRLLDWKEAMAKNPQVIAESTPSEVYVRAYLRYAQPS